VWEMPAVIISRLLQVISAVIDSNAFPESLASSLRPDSKSPHRFCLTKHWYGKKESRPLGRLSRTDNSA
jgi:hypothetical protein